ncbi:MAG TPA: AIR synthase related protein, partial [Candidatus Rubrimentiphilum sp.]|nr:AIR synthase related protein [Candidatus Rubrimentiphilum sp.]
DVSDPDSHQRYVAQQVVDGIGAYGNAIGVPNIAGDAYFDERFNDNCLVNVVALGLVKESEIIHSRAPKNSAGWDIVLVGKATDASGFGGASFSSLTLEEENQEANKGAVQVPDPFLKNVIMRASYRVFEYLREKKITAGFKDLGAGGIMGCTAELCAAGGMGAIIDLDDVNVAVAGVPPEVIAVGETQERLCWILPGDATLDVLRIYNEEFSLPEIAREARAVVIGAVQNEKRYVLRHSGETVMDVPIDLLTAPISDRERLPAITRPSHASGVPSLALLGTGSVVARDDKGVFASFNACSREPLYKQYDAVVRGTTVIPRGHADAGVIAPIPGAPFGVALSVGRNVFEAVAKVVAVGARPLGLTDCLNFGNPNNTEHYAQLVEAVAQLAEEAKHLNLPFVSGNVSLYNESSSGNTIPPSAIIACVGVVDDLQNIVTLDFKRPNSPLYVIDSLDAMLAAVKGRQLLSAHAISDGDLLATAAHMSFASHNDFGANFAQSVEFTAPMAWLVEAKSAETLRPARLVGTTTAADIEGEVDISIGGQSWDIDELYDAWRKPLAEIYA